MNTKKLNKGVYQYSFEINFIKTQAVNGGESSKEYKGFAIAEVFQTGFEDAELKWGYSLEILDENGDLMFDESAYPTPTKKELVAILADMESSELYEFYY